MNSMTKAMAYKILGPAGVAVLIGVAAFIAGFRIRGGSEETAPAHGHDPPAEAAATADVWTCSMHPQIKLPKPGNCPICFMDLIPLAADEADDEGPRELLVSEAAKALMVIETAPVERRFVTAEVRMVGKVDYDETRVSNITAWVPGRLDRLFVDYTGVPVKKGDHMVTLYSPELLGAQEELLQAIKAADQLEDSPPGIVRETARGTVEAARDKLRLWGLTAEQIETLERRKSTEDHVTIYAPSGGIVIDKNAREGMYVNTGTRIYTIADLSRVWVNLAAYESDLRWLKYGQKVQFAAESYPGELFTGTISFIHPVLDEATRTVKVRVNVPNESGRLKPGMFVRAVAEAKVGAGGRIMDAALAGKWISPMHPEIVKDEPGPCDVCGMPLVRAESLGYVGAEPNAGDLPLVIPATAPLLTGRRAVVYVELAGRDKPTYEGREIVLGPRAGGHYLVEHGLSEGERVVTHGAFKLDAELQIRARPSMMNPEGGGSGGTHAHHGGPPAQSAPALDPEFKKQLGTVIDGYLEIQVALANSDARGAKAGAVKALAALAGVDMGLLQGDDHNDWIKHADALEKLLNALAAAAGIEPVRAQFALLSDQVAVVLIRFGSPGKPLYRASCPMAFDNRGASWVQAGDEVNNPYFGDVMLRCGEIEEVLK
ncbi:MAG: efflux RND transporter periplasmic adaptor subunit [Lentisphaeria bacterium]|nr:efflux RND transporter periplasmic adaptor subunit [Lentisphaeria bacterium]